MSVCVCVSVCDFLFLCSCACVRVPVRACVQRVGDGGADSLVNILWSSASGEVEWLVPAYHAAAETHNTRSRYTDHHFFGFS